MGKGQQIGRRTWLAQVALGSFAVWSELSFGLGRRGWGVAIGGRDLAIGVAHAQSLGPTEAGAGELRCHGELITVSDLPKLRNLHRQENNESS